LVLQGASVSRSSPKAFRKKGAPLTFWKKWEAGQAHEGTYLVFAGSCRGLHFPGQAPKPIATKMPKGLFGESETQVQHMRGISSFCLVLQGASFSRSSPKAFRKKGAPLTFWKKWEAGQAHEGTYLVFAGSCRGLHFPGQAQTLSRQRCPRDFLGKVEGRSNT
jgi:hypothetical protein